MKVTPFIGRKGDVVCEVDGILCLFDRRGEQPKAGVEIEVMIFKSLGLKQDKRDPEKFVIPALIVRPATGDDVLVMHKGFECSGSMCCTDASLTKESQIYLQSIVGRSLWRITPGLTPVRYADNVNVRFDRREPTPLVPGEAYMSATDLKAGHRRIAGVPALEEIDPCVLVRLVRRKARAEA